MSTFKDDMNKKVNVEECSPQQRSLVDDTDTKREGLVLCECFYCKEKNIFKPKTDHKISITSSNCSVLPHEMEHIYDADDDATDDDDSNEEDGTCEISRDKIYLRECNICPSRDINFEEVNLDIKPCIYEIINRFITNINKADCDIIVHGKKFRCHKLVLQCYSSFFEERQINGPIELNVSKVSSSAFSYIYKWMMKDENCHEILRKDNILDVFTAASFLGVSDLEEQCWCLFNCDETFREDSAYSLFVEAMRKSNSVIANIMLPRINKFFWSLISSKDFVELPVEIVVPILNSRDITVYNEIEVFMAATRWLMYDWEQRRCCVENVMRCIRFGNISTCQLLDMRRNQNNPEFLEILSIPEIDKIFHGGLSYAVLLESNGNTPKDSKFKNYVKSLGIAEPEPRNYAIDGKRLSSYREFLQELEIYKLSIMKTKLDSIIQHCKERFCLDSKIIPTDLSLKKLNNNTPHGSLASNCINLPITSELQANIASQDTEPKPGTSTEQCRAFETSSPSNVTITQNTPGTSYNTSTVPISETVERVPPAPQKDKPCALTIYSAKSAVCKSNKRSLTVNNRKMKTAPITTRSYAAIKNTTRGSLFTKGKNCANIPSQTEDSHKLKGVVTVLHKTMVTQAKKKITLSHYHQDCSSSKSSSMHTSKSKQFSTMEAFPPDKKKSVNVSITKKCKNLKKCSTSSLCNQAGQHEPCPYNSK